VAAESCGQGRAVVDTSLSQGLAGAGGCPGYSCVVWRAAELQAVTGLLPAPEGEAESWAWVCSTLGSPRSGERTG